MKTLEEYKELSIQFNKLSFCDKIVYLQEHSDVFTLASDGNY